MKGSRSSGERSWQNNDQNSHFTDARVEATRSMTRLKMRQMRVLVVAKDDIHVEVMTRYRSKVRSNRS